MKRLILLILCGGLVLAMQAQEKRVPFIDPPRGQDRFLIEFHHNFWEQVPENVELRDVSVGFSTQVMYNYRTGPRSPLSLAWGYGLSSYSVHHNSFFRNDTVQGQNFTRLVPHDKSYNYKKNKVVTTFLDVPLELRLCTRGENKFKLYAGGKIGVLINHHTKVIDDEGKRKNYTIRNISYINYGLTLRIGVNRFALSGYYGLSEFFRPGEGTPLRPIAVGLTIFLI